MILNIIMWLTMYPVIFIMYFILRSEMKQNKGILLGVRIREEWSKEREVQQIIEDYKKQLSGWMLLLAICPVGTFFIKHTSLQFTFWMMWLLLVIGLLYLPYIRANDRLKKWKEQNRVKDSVSGHQEKVYVDLKAVGRVGQVKLTSFLPSLGISLMLCIMVLTRLNSSDMKSLGYTVIGCGAITFLFYFVARAVDHMRIEVISLESEVNIQYGKAKRKAWKNYWLFMAWGNTLYTAMQAIAFMKQEQILLGFIGSAIVYSIAIVAACMVLIAKMNKIEAHFAAKTEVAHAWDEDKYWKMGTFYYNPEDKHIWVNKRAGIGTTVNMATAAGKVLVSISILCILIIPITCILLIILEFTPISLQADSSYIYARQLKLDYQLPVSEAADMTLIDELPPMSKVKGTGMDNLEKGTFYVKGKGSCEVFLNPQNHKFISFTIQDKQYYMSAADDEKTMEVYEKLTKNK